MAKAILIADDLEDDTILIQLALTNAGVRNPVLTVHDGSQVLAYFKGEGLYSDRHKFPLPGVLLLDLKMPRMNGFQVMEWLRTQPQFQDLLVIVLSGNHEVAEAQLASELGARSFLTKPCNIADVKNLMQRFTGYWENGDSL